MSKIDKMSLDEKIKKLNEMVAWFNGEEFRVDLAPERYQKAMELVKKIENDLTNLKNQVVKITEDFS